MSSLELDRRLADLAAPKTRRGVLVGAGSLALAASLSRLPLDLAYGSPVKHHSDPFTLGVASGDPLHDSIVLWTRLAPEPLRADGGMEPRPVEVRWEVAKDPSMRRLVRRGRTTAWPSFAHSVHVEVDGLDDGREYFYRFTTGSAASPVGRTRTAPRGRVSELTFSFCTCQKWDDGFYPAYREIAREDHDFVIHLGDYTYEYGIANDTGPRKPNLPPEFTTETETLERYRLQHALYKTDPHLQAAHRAHPFIVIWDDHEVLNDYTGDPVWFCRAAPTPTARSTSTCRCARSRSRAARTCRSTARSRGATWPSSACSTRGSTATNPPCGYGEAERCAAAFEPEYTMLGPAQEQLAAEEPQALGRALELHRQPGADGRARPRRPRPGDDLFWNDSWDGYPAARNRITQFLKDERIRNPVVITGDWHSTFANDVKADYEDPRAKTVAAEFVTPSVTSNGDAEVYGPYYGPMIQFNPHIRFFDGDRHGSMKARLKRDELEVDWRIADTVGDPNARVRTLRTFAVESGRPGIAQA